MKLFNSFLLLLLLGAASFVKAQTVVPVASGLGTLNDAISSYIAQNGNTSLDVIFQLEDGGFYILTATIENASPLRIESAPGSVVRPVIRPNVPAGGDPFRCFRARNNLMLKGLYVTNEDALGGVADQIIRASADNISLRLDSCHLDVASQAGIRIDNTNNKLYITNSIFSNIVNLPNPANGRGVDDRGNSVDTIWVENSTFYNLSSRIIRNGGGVTNFVRINQVTSVNTGDRTFELGEVAEATLTNSIFVNTGFLGFNAPGASTLRIDSTAFSQSATISNINLYEDPALQTLYNQLNVNAAAGDSVYLRTGFNGGIISFATAAGTLETLTGEAVPFNNPPPTPIAYVQSFYQNPNDVQPIDDGNGGPDPANISQLPFDFGFARESALFTAGNEGQPLGDLNWHDLSSSTFDPAVAVELQLEVFPNPVQNQVNFRFELPSTQPVRLMLYNQLGQAAAVVANKEMGAGAQQLTYDVSQLPRGVYFYRLEIGQRFASGRLLLNR